MIRKIEARDREFYIEAAKALYSSDAVMHSIPDANFEKTFDELMRSDEYAFCFILESGGIPAGYALMSRTFSQEAGGMVVWIEELYILPRYRGRGLAGEFFNELFALYPAARYRLEVEWENKGAIRLYERLGFRRLPYGQMMKGD